MLQAEYAAIRPVMDLYGFAVDTQRWDLFDQVFTPDVHADYGGGKPYTDLASFKRDFEAVHKKFDRTQHDMTNVICDVTGDRAKAITYGHWLLVREGTPGGDFWHGHGWYDDDLVRTPDGWRISRRSYGTLRWTGNSAVQSLDDHPFPISLRSLQVEADGGRIGLLPGLIPA